MDEANPFGFLRQEKTCLYLDPGSGFQEKALTLEIRHDPLGDVTSHILPHRFRSPGKPDLQAWRDRSPEATCPFCPALFDRLTPRFPPDTAVDGRFCRGEAALFPNAFPHDGHNAIVRFSDRHWVPLEALTPSYLRNGFLVCRDYARRLAAQDPGLRFCSINWNYMPPAGGGLIHPHLQTLAAHEPTRFVAKLRSAAASHRKQAGRGLWTDLLAWERQKGERHVAAGKSAAWLASFAPRGMAGEIAFFFPERRSLFQLAGSDMEELLEGLHRVFRFLHDRDFASFNASLYAPLEEDDLFCVQGRLLPRFHLLPLGTSDVNYFDKCHGEVICPVRPEDLCRDLSPYFSAPP